MKKIVTGLFLIASGLLIAQKNAGPKEAPQTAMGYYVLAKGKKGVSDTVKGEIRINPDNEYDFYQGFQFKDPKKGGKLILMNSSKVKAYGIGDDHYMAATLDGNQVFVKYMAQGRLNFVEFKYPTTLGGKPITGADYYIQDTQADEEHKDLRELKKLKDKFYKKELKPYMASQEMIWSDLDKFTFKPEAVANSIREYNSYYESSGKTAEEEDE